MSMTDPVFQWLAYELAAIFAILFIWVLLRARRKQKRTQTAAAKTARLLKNSYEQRVVALSSQLSSRYGLSGAALDSMVEELMLREKEIYKSIVNLYTQQDEKTLKNLPEQITALTDATISIMEADAELEATGPELIVEENEDVPADELEAVDFPSKLRQKKRINSMEYLMITMQKQLLLKLRIWMTQQRYLMNQILKRILILN